VYSVHESDVYCVAKGKARHPYEFGSKVALAVTHKQGLVVSMQALERAAYDGHTLGATLEKCKELSGKQVKRVFVDRGYKGHGVTQCASFESRKE